MMDAETLRFIREEIKRQMNVILNAAVGDNDTQTETIDALFPGMAGIPGRPVMHPFGFVSRATPGTISVTAKTGDHVGNRMVIGHRDAKRPDDPDVGESVVYSSGDYRIKVANGQILVGKGGAYEPVIMGETMRQLCISLINLIVEHTHLGNLGIETSEPLNFLEFEELRIENLDNSLILAEDGGRF